MSFFDILQLALRNLRQAKLRAILTTMGVIVGVAVIVTMVSFGLGLQRNMLSRFKALDLFNEIQVFGRSLGSMVSTRTASNSQRNENDRRDRRSRLRPDEQPTRILDDAGIAEIAKFPGVAYVEPSLTIVSFVRSNGHSQVEGIGGASVPNASSRFKEFIAGQMISSAEAAEAVVNETFVRDFGFEKPQDAIGKTIEFLAPPDQGLGMRLRKSLRRMLPFGRVQKKSCQVSLVCRWTMKLPQGPTASRWLPSHFASWAC